MNTIITWGLGEEQQLITRGYGKITFYVPILIPPKIPIQVPRRIIAKIPFMAEKDVKGTLIIEFIFTRTTLGTLLNRIEPIVFLAQGTITRMMAHSINIYGSSFFKFLQERAIKGTLSSIFVHIRKIRGDLLRKFEQTVPIKGRKTFETLKSILITEEEDED